MPLFVNLTMMKPRTVLPPPLMVRPFVVAPALVPLSTITGTGVAGWKPGWVVASMMTGEVMVGSAVVGEIVQRPVTALKPGSAVGMLKLIELRFALLLASRIAWRSDPAPL